jgi:hypothetical protein
MLPARSLLTGLPVAAAVLALAGCAIDDGGPRTTQNRHVAAFTRIDNRGAADLRVHVGEARSVRVEAGRHVIGDVGTAVHDGTLQVTYDHDGFWHRHVTVDVSVPRLRRIAISGSGDVDADGIAGGALDLRTDGSGDITAQGRVDRVSLDANGSGDADLSALDAGDAAVSIGGSGDADVRAGRRLDVAVDGSGDVRYHGHPALTQHIDGSGDVTAAG